LSNNIIKLQLIVEDDEINIYLVSFVYLQWTTEIQIRSANPDMKVFDICWSRQSEADRDADKSRERERGYIIKSRYHK
jgi:hypothetical protein